jgi:hypothetical protein
MAVRPCTTPIWRSTIVPPTGRFAGVEQLAGDPFLITVPVDPVSRWSWPYSQTVADIYASTVNNGVITDPFIVGAQDAIRLQLSPGGRLTYPGRWAAPP